MPKRFSKQDKNFTAQFFERYRIKALPPSAGKLLISEPFLTDPHFGRTIIYLCEVNEDGAMGFILNKSTGLTVGEVVNDLTCLTQDVFYGGPVGHDQLFYVHGISQLADSKPLGQNLYWGGNFKQFCNLAIDGKVNEDNCKFFVGYSGWGPQQLLDEIKEGSWIVTEAESHSIFKLTDKEDWSTFLKQMGKRYGVMANFPEDPSMN